ncbi:MAG TPA: TetR/AcrR family transcriptional regulator [Xanthobacteraceae bacterium]|nr:TetR/AcrR family transcriptional regulator [Xanthobacteraceae bacterium]
MAQVTAMARNGDTAQRILDIAERLMQVRGYNGFSYADIAETMRLTKASLHYHFPSKSELGRRLMERYTENFLAALGRIDATGADAHEKLQRYVSIYAEVLANKRMCLCGMLAAEYATLPKSVKAEVTRFFDANETWLVGLLQEGKRSKDVNFGGSATEIARTITASLEGAMMLARAYDDAERFNRAAERLLADIAGSPSARERQLTT